MSKEDKKERTKGRGRPKLPEDKKRVGRPAKLTPEMQENILASVSKGYFVETAGALAGVSHDCIRHWLREGARGNEPYREFSALVKKAQAKAEADLLDRIDLAGNVSMFWQANAWRLQRLFPKQYGRQAEDPEKAELERKKLEADIARIESENALLKAKLAEVQRGGSALDTTLNVNVLAWPGDDDGSEENKP